MAKLNRKKVMEYVEKYWQNPNSDYFDYGKSDCTNFVSQAWHYGGIPITSEWRPADPITGRLGGTSSWTVVSDLADYLVNHSIAVMKWSSTEAKVGDIIQFYNADRGGWYHSGIVSDFDSVYGLTYAAHSDAHFRKPLSDVYLKPDPEGVGVLSAVRFLCPTQEI